MHFGGKQEQCAYTKSLCALIYDKFGLLTHPLHPTVLFAVKIKS